MPRASNIAIALVRAMGEHQELNAVGKYKENQP